MMLMNARLHQMLEFEPVVAPFLASYCDAIAGIPNAE
jgi:hypothetical protein